VPGNADVDAGIVPHGNRHLIVHECPAFESGCDQNNMNILEFIERRTGEDLSTSERLHAVWLRCHVRDGSNDCLMKINSGYVFPRQILLPKTLEME
jgi:hypothetical protein